MRTKEQQNAIRERLEGIAAANGGLLTPEQVVADAKAKDSPLHAVFDWNVKDAAHNWWLCQARDLIRSVRVVIRTENTEVQTVGYVRDPSLPADTQGYRSTASIRSDHDKARDVLIDEFTRAAAALRRARELAAAFALSEQVDFIVEEIDTVRRKVTSSVEVRPN